MTDKPLRGLKAILGVPSYGPVDPLCARDLRVAMMVASKDGIDWVGDASTDRLGFSAARNNIAKSIYGPNGEPIADGIMWVDSDMRQKPGDISNLLRSSLQYNEGFVTGVYHQRAVDMLPVIYEYKVKTGKFYQMGDYPQNAFMQISGCGFGFVWTSFEVIEAIRKSKNFTEKRGWFPDERDSGGFGEDLSFCHQAILAGKQLYMNSAVLPGHVGEPIVVSREEFLKKKLERESIVNVECKENLSED